MQNQRLQVHTILDQQTRIQWDLAIRSTVGRPLPRASGVARAIAWLSTSHLRTQRCFVPPVRMAPRRITAPRGRRTFFLTSMRRGLARGCACPAFRFFPLYFLCIRPLTNVSRVAGLLTGLISCRRIAMSLHRIVALRDRTIHTNRKPVERIACDQQSQRRCFA